MSCTIFDRHVAIWSIFLAFWLSEKMSFGCLRTGEAAFGLIVVAVVALAEVIEAIGVVLAGVTVTAAAVVVGPAVVVLIVGAGVVVSAELLVRELVIAAAAAAASAASSAAAAATSVVLHVFSEVVTTAGVTTGGVGWALVQVVLLHHLQLPDCLEL